MIGLHNNDHDDYDNNLRRQSGQIYPVAYMKEYITDLIQTNKFFNLLIRCYSKFLESPRSGGGGKGGRRRRRNSPDFLRGVGGGGKTMTIGLGTSERKYKKNEKEGDEAVAAETTAWPGSKPQ